jgi:hypothetical protein
VTSQADRRSRSRPGSTAPSTIVTNMGDPFLPD